MTPLNIIEISSFYVLNSWQMCVQFRRLHSWWRNTTLTICVQTFYCIVWAVSNEQCWFQQTPFVLEKLELLQRDFAKWTKQRLKMSLLQKQKDKGKEQGECHRQTETGLLKESEGLVCVCYQIPSLHSEQFTDMEWDKFIWGTAEWKMP